MNRAFIERKWRRKVFAPSCALLGLIQSASAQFVEVTVQIEEAYPRSSHIYNSLCVFGTNNWMIDGEFTVNSKATLWCTDTNIIRREVITKKALPMDSVIFSGSPIISDPSLALGASPEVGEEFVRVHRAYDKRPLAGPPYVHWLAFCSGSFLKAKGRELMPFYPGLGNCGPYRDTTQSFRDAPGLPQRVDIYRNDGKLVCSYEVQQSTNFSGWTIPLRFTATQHILLGGNRPDQVFVLSAKVTSVREAAAPAPPPEILSRANYW
jgi:hypothetical protein